MTFYGFYILILFDPPSLNLKQRKITLTKMRGKVSRERESTKRNNLELKYFILGIQNFRREVAQEKNYHINQPL